MDKFWRSITFYEKKVAGSQLVKRSSGIEPHEDK
jgi:hypothetical protein